MFKTISRIRPKPNNESSDSPQQPERMDIRLSPQSQAIDRIRPKQSVAFAFGGGGGVNISSTAKRALIGTEVPRCNFTS